MNKKEPYDIIVAQLVALDDRTLEQVLKGITARNIIRNRMIGWKIIEDEQNQELKDIRESCKHIAKSEKKIWYEDEYGKMLSTGYYEYICPDCGWRNSVEFDEDA